MRGNHRVLATAVAATLGLLTTVLVNASPAQAMNPCQSDNPPEYCFDPPPPPPAPTAPSSLVATAVLQTTVSLQWHDGTTTETAYHIRRLLNGVNTTFDRAANTTTFTDTVPAGSYLDYYVWAQTCDADGCSNSPSAHLTVQTHPAPANPTGSLNYGSGMTQWGTFYWSGWAIDWDTSQPIQLATVLDGVVQGVSTASGAVTNLNQTYPGYGDNHGFTLYAYKSAVPGTHTECLRALNVGGGSDTNLYCGSYVVAGPPAAASNLTLQNTGTSMVIGFTDNASDETGFWLQRSLDAGASWLSVGSQYPPVSGVGSRGSATDYSSPPAGTCYRILMTNAQGNTPSASVCSS